MSNTKKKCEKLEYIYLFLISISSDSSFLSLNNYFLNLYSEISLRLLNENSKLQRKDFEAEST